MDESSETERRLRALIDKGFRFVHPRDPGGDVVEVVGLRAHDEVVDVVRIIGETEVVAARLPADEPDILAPTTVLWRRAGAADEVLDALLALADDDSTLQPKTRRGESSGWWVPVRAGTSAWVRADP